MIVYRIHLILNVKQVLDSAKNVARYNRPFHVSCLGSYTVENAVSRDQLKPEISCASYPELYMHFAAKYWRN